MRAQSNRVLANQIDGICFKVLNIRLIKRSNLDF